MLRIHCEECAVKVGVPCFQEFQPRCYLSLEGSANLVVLPYHAVEQMQLWSLTDGVVCRVVVDRFGKVCTIALDERRSHVVVVDGADIQVYVLSFAESAADYALAIYIVIAVGRYNRLWQDMSYIKF